MTRARDASTPSSSRGARRMRACGYRGRGGLGPREQGRVEPVEARVKRDRAGLGSARARGYEIVGATTTRARSTTDARERASKRATTTRDDDDDDDDDGTAKAKARAIRANAEAKARRDAELARAVYRAFKSEDGEGGRDNPVARATLGGMSARNPLRGKTRGYSYNGDNGGAAVSARAEAKNGSQSSRRIVR